MNSTLTRLARGSRQVPASLRAHLDAFEIGEGFVVLTGWVVSGEDTRVVEPLSITVDGQTFSPIPLEARSDFQNLGVADGQAGFMVALPLRVGKSVPHMVISDATGASADLSSSNFRVLRFSPRGAIDNVDAEGISGWIFDPALMARSGKAFLAVDGGAPEEVSLGFDRSDVPYTFFGHPRRFGFHHDVSAMIREATQAAPGVTGRRKLTFELFSGNDRVCSHAEVLTLGENAAREPAQLDVAPAVALTTEPRLPSASRPRMLVVSWDMGHNPAGRAYLLADIARRDFDVKLIGPLFKQYGGKLWEPLEGQSAVDIEMFPGGPLADYLRTIVEQVERHPADIVYVSKPRLPSLIFGFLMRARHGATLIVDIDDHELSFYKDDKPLGLDAALRFARANPAEAEMPYANVWTQLCEELVTLANGLTVSNIALQERFGGIIVRHARDESVFSINEDRRLAVRGEFGLKEGDRAIVFVGTPRAHKGIYRIAEALERLNDDRLVFVMIGSFTDAATKKQIAKYKKARIACFNNQPWERLPELVAMADAVAILQDPNSRVCEYQIPAKLTDALALGRPVLASRVRPFSDLFDKNALLPVISDDDLDGFLEKLANEPGAFADHARRGRTQFLSEFSYSVNAARLNLAASEARKASSHATDEEIARVLKRIFKYAGVAYPYGDFGGVAAPAIKPQARQHDLVFFWKQNDSDIYGRRSDMLVKYLMKSGRFRRIIHFDRSLTLGELEATVDRGPHAPLHQGNLIYMNSMRRIFKMADRGGIYRRTFLCRNGSIPQTFLGADLPPRSAYVDFVRDTLKECGVDAPPVAWVCPVVFDFPKLQESIAFERVVADIIDDQRKWEGKTDYMNRVAQNYVDVLKTADLVLANCEPVRKGFSDLRDDVVVVPNGTEVFPPDRAWTVPDDLVDLPRPIVGYVGNLRDRIDFSLIRRMALSHPEWSIVLIGSAHGALDVHALSEIPNVRLMGVRPYDEAVNYIKNFDVAMMPHISNELTENMNPLKLYVYFSLGVPVVTTEVANIGDIAPYVSVARTHDEFIEATEVLVRSKSNRVDAEQRGKVLDKVSWTSRVDDILESLCL